MTQNQHQLTLFCADTTGEARNCLYPHEVHAFNGGQLRKALSKDHVFVKFKDNRRSNENFEYADLLVLDCDNDGSDRQEDWIWPEDLAELLPGVVFYTYTSRHHNMQKGSHSPRPRFHAIFPIDRVHDAAQYASLKQSAARLLPFFDGNALDAGRFFFGVENAQIGVFRGSLSLTDWMREEEDPSLLKQKTIPEGQRNATLSHAASRLIKRYGDTEEAFHRFEETAALCSPPLPDRELQAIWRSARRFYTLVSSQSGYISPDEYNASGARQGEWEVPIPLDQPKLPDFPVEALPKPVAEYVLAVAESLQVPADMAAACALGVLSVCAQRKFAVRLTPDWREPVNLYLLVIAEPSERKSPCIKIMIRPILEYETGWNRAHDVEIETSHEMKNALHMKTENIRKDVVRGKATYDDLERAKAEELAYQPMEKLRLFVDDVTSEELTRRMAANGGACAIMSAEGGVFDNFAGRYSGKVNINNLLQAYSADPIRVDRATREGETITDPALTILLMAQPDVLSGVMGNDSFRGRGLNARFLYVLPKSMIGSRRVSTLPIPEEVRAAYDKVVLDLLSIETDQTEEIFLSPEAESLRLSFAQQVEKKLADEYADLLDWGGKIVGTTMRIAALLCLAQFGAEGNVPGDGWAEFPHYEITAENMRNAISISDYLIAHAKVAYSRMGADKLKGLCKKALRAIVKHDLKQFSIRDLQQKCSISTADEVQKIVDHLVDLGYCLPLNPEDHRKPGRPSNPKYNVNPFVFQKDLPGAA